MSEEPHMNFREFFIVLEPWTDCFEFKDIASRSKWHENRGTAMGNATKGAYGLLKVNLEIERFNEEPACGAV